jgi:DNA-nicking Smr family endonuclease
MRVPFRTGDRVCLLDEPGNGVILRFHGEDRAVVRTSDGFELEYPLVKLVHSSKHQAYQVSDHQARLIAANDRALVKRTQKVAPRPGKTPKRPPDNSVAEVDLHLHELLENEGNLRPEERLSYQLAYFERALEAAIRDGKRKLIVIHGIGEGVLREEVRRVLQYYESVRFADADARRYGAGATEVEILRR